MKNWDWTPLGHDEDMTPAQASERITELRAKHRLGFLNNPGGAAFSRDDLGRCQIYGHDPREDLDALLAWLRDHGIDP